MIICACQNLSEAALRAAIQRGCKTIVQLQDKLNVCTNCSKCSEQCQRILCEEMLKSD